MGLELLHHPTPNDSVNDLGTPTGDSYCHHITQYLVLPPDPRFSSIPDSIDLIFQNILRHSVILNPLNVPKPTESLGFHDFHNAFTVQHVHNIPVCAGTPVLS